MAVCEGKQPITIITCSMTNVTAPPSLLGTIIEDTAGQLGMLTVVQMLNPGNPCILCSMTGATDMRSVQAQFASAEACLMDMAMVAMAKYYKIPVRNIGTHSDSLDLDYQCGVESTLTAQTGILGNVDYFSYAVGTLGSYNYGSFEKFVMDEEMLRYLGRIQKGIDFSEGCDCFDLMKEIGPRGNFISRRTPKAYRQEHYLSKLFHHSGNTMAMRSEIPTLREKARAEVKKRLEEYQMPELTKEQDKILNKYLKDIEFKID